MGAGVEHVRVEVEIVRPAVGRYGGKGFTLVILSEAKEPKLRGRREVGLVERFRLPRVRSG